MYTGGGGANLHFTPDPSHPVCRGETLAFVKATLHKLFLKMTQALIPPMSIVL